MISRIALAATTLAMQFGTLANASADVTDSSPQVGGIDRLVAACDGRLGISFASSVFPSSWGRSNADGTFDLFFAFTPEDLFYRFYTTEVSANVLSIKADVFTRDGSGYQSAPALDPLVVDLTKLQGAFETDLAPVTGSTTKFWRIECTIQGGARN